jgi:inositol phosphorylceramide mannosyltransferase catalytic subunit
VADRTPRTVHFVWVGPPMPKSLAALRDRLLAFDPHIEVRIWDDDALRTLHNQTFFDSERRASAKADLARFEILLNHGGIYLDADFDVHRSIEPIFEAIDRHGLVVARQSPTVYNPAFIGAQAGHPLLQALVDGIPASYRDTGEMKSAAVATTGPHYVTEQLLQHLRSGGRYYELPQHVIFPWYSDETALAAEAVPDDVLLSHEWATIRGTWSGGESPVADVRPAGSTLTPRDRRRLNGSSLRVRAATSPVSHALIARAESLRVALDPASWLTVPRVHAKDSASLLTPTETAIERAFSLIVAKSLRGSAVFVDIDPCSPLPSIAASRSLDRPGRAIAVIDAEDRGLSDSFERSRWSDASLRCTTHLIRTSGWTDDGPTRITSRGTPLIGRSVDAKLPPNAPVSVDGPSVATILGALPRIDLVRASGHTVTPLLASTLSGMMQQGRILKLAITLDPMSAEVGTTHAIDLLTQLSELGHGFSVAPWLIDPRGRTWRQHLRVAARPFLLVSQGS